MERTLLPIVEDLRGWSMANDHAVTAVLEAFDRNDIAGPLGETS